MSVVAVHILHVGHGENVELLHAGTSSRVNGEKNWPRNSASDYADQSHDLEDSDVEIGIERLMGENVFIGKPSVTLDPIELGEGFWFWRSLPVRRKWLVLASWRRK